MREEDLVEKWCFEKDLENEGFLNRGEFGNAYEITDDKVIKITSDYNEFIQTFNTLNVDDPNLTKVYEMRVFPYGKMGILMEKLITDNVEDLFSSLSMEAEIQGVDLLDIETEDSFLPDELIKFTNDLNASVQTLQKLGVAHFDIHGLNIGLNSEGNYVLFDQTNKNTKDYDEDLFEEIKSKLSIQFEIDESIYKKDVCLEHILCSRSAMSRTLLDISNNKVSQTEGGIECMYNSNGDLQLIDGYHRLCEALLKGEAEMDVKIVFDERTGYSHPLYSRIDLSESLEIDVTLNYCGLEDIADDETLDDYYEQYLNYKEKSKENLKVNNIKKLKVKH